MNFFKFFPLLAFYLNAFSSSFFYIDDAGTGDSDVDNVGSENENQETDNPDEDDNISRKDDRWKLDAFRYKKERNEIQKERDRLAEQLKEQDRKKLIEQNRWKEAFEKEHEEKITLKERFETESRTVEENLKAEAIEKEAIKQGIDEEFIDFLHTYDLGDLTVEKNELGRKKVVGAKEFIESLKATKPKLFNTKRDPSINNKGGGNSFATGSFITYAELMKIERTDPVKYRQLHNDIKSGKIKFKR